VFDDAPINGPVRELTHGVPSTDFRMKLRGALNHVCGRVLDVVLERNAIVFFHDGLPG
jgi:hypothetical protein